MHAVMTSCHAAALRGKTIVLTVLAYEERLNRRVKRMKGLRMPAGRLYRGLR
jgi:hypothetical protein